MFGPDERNQLYGKLSGSYVVSDEDFWADGLGNIMPVFKLRASWGQAGNLTALGPFDRFSNYFDLSLQWWDGRAALYPPRQRKPRPGTAG